MTIKERTPRYLHQMRLFNGIRVVMKFNGKNKLDFVDSFCKGLEDGDKKFSSQQKKKIQKGVKLS